MKKYFGLQKVILALTTLTLVGLSSCNDQNFDWDEAHATQQYEKFTNVFIEKFGKPADGHQWGYDLARQAMSGETVMPTVTTRAQNNHFFKQDEGSPRPYVLYTPPAHIKKNEHEDVFAWFSTHKVEWSNNPAYYGQFTDKSGNVLNTRNTSSNVAELDFSWYQKHVDQNIESIDQIKTLENDYRGYNTITKYQTNPCGNYTVDASKDLDFHNGWVQHIANDPTTEINGYGHNYNCFKMDYFSFRGLESTGEWWTSHSYDFNGAKGYGWMANDTSAVVKDGNLNATLYLNVNFKDATYHSSIDSRPHDKFLLVYLKGDDGNGNTWEGWYLGFDLEGYLEPGSSDTNQYLKTDGFCNDWIIKIVDAGQSVYQNSRIMCEDLGGTINKNSSDIDYNDIVIDVSYDQNGKYVDIKPQCAGGTLPILICYDDVPLFEVHEYFLASDDNHRVFHKEATYRLSEIQYKTMINTQGNKPSGDGSFITGFSVQDYRLLFGESSNSVLSKSFPGKFDIDKLQIKVYRHNLADYVTNPGTVSSADWISLDKLETGVPLKFIVPQYDSNYKSIRWLQERQMITDGYKNFNDWVANPALWFWENVSINGGNTHTVTIDESYLYNPY